MIRSAAEILHEYGPFPGVDHVHGVTFLARALFRSSNLFGRAIPFLPYRA